MDLSDLPKGWVVRESKSRGRSYFFNTSTGLSSWKHPALISDKSRTSTSPKKHRHSNDGADTASVTSDHSKHSHVLLSPASPTSSFASTIKLSSKSLKITSIKDKKHNHTITSPKEVSPEHQFQCSRARANHIAQWVSSVNSNTDESKQDSLSESVLSTEWKEGSYSRKMKRKKKKKRDKPFSVESKNTERISTEVDSPDKDTTNNDSKGEQPKLTDNTISSTQEPQQSTDSKLSKADESKRPPLKKVNKRNKTANTKLQSPTKTMPSPAFTTKPITSPPFTTKPMASPLFAAKPIPSPSFAAPFFSPFSHGNLQQERKQEATVTPMNIDKSSQRFSTPFMKSQPQTGLQDLFSSPINLTSPTYDSPFSNNSARQCENESTKNSSNDAEQPDSGFDEVIDMDVDNFEEMTQLIKAELQEVRSDFHLDIEKAKQGSFGDSSDYQDGVHIVLDTNVLLSHLKFINELKDLPIEGIGRPILVVPWIVMQELDSLKSDSRRPRENTEDGAVGVDSLARQAIRFLHSCFESKHPRVRGQTVDEASQQVNTLLDETNDDRILHCCLVVKRNVDKGESVLLSNDQNLCNKAMINGVKAFNHQNLINGLKEMVPAINTLALQADNFKEYNEQLIIQERLAKKRAKADDILCELKCIMREGLAVTVESEMRAAYDDLWDTILYIKPPWTVLDLLQILNKHWIAVFGDVLGRKLQSTVKELLKLLDPEKGVPGCIANVSIILQHSRQILDAFALRSSYNGTITKCVAAVQVLQQKCKDCRTEDLPRLILPNNHPQIAGALPDVPPITPTYIDESTPTNSDDTASVSSLSVHGEINSTVSKHPHSQILSTFEVIWSAVTQFSAQIFNTLSYPSPYPISVIENLPTPTRNEAISFMGVLCRCLSALVTALQNVLRIPVEGLNEGRHSLEKLIFSIHSFTKEIIGQNSQMSTEALLYFCQDSNTRSALVQGVSQLDRALAVLQHCASCVV